VIDSEVIKPEVDSPQNAMRLLRPDQTDRETLNDYRASGGYAPAAWQRTPAELIDLISQSGLRGRGGSAFPTGIKWGAVAAQRGKRMVLVNAAESEPASNKDRALLLLRPHLVIEGALLAAHALDAREIIFYLHADATTVEESVLNAIAELKGSGPMLPRMRLVMAERGYVAGEETAAIQRANGKPARPTFKPPLPFEDGVKGRPTLVQNVETLANVPLIARHGAAWFRSIGTPELPGTLLITLSGAVANPGVYEVPGGAEIRWILEESGGLLEGESLYALLPGGFFSGWIDEPSIRRGARLEPNSLRASGAMLGTAAITVVPDSVCGLEQAVALLRFFAAESARQCGPCTHGTTAMAIILGRIVDGKAEHDDLSRLEHYANEMLPKRGACGHLDGATLAARTALSVFRREIPEHMKSGTCGRSRRVILPGFERFEEYA
jgi:NADH:ubiquinone oxidoreductase subunit F (NADH-binding)